MSVLKYMEEQIRKVRTKTERQTSYRLLRELNALCGLNVKEREEQNIKSFSRA